MNCAKHPEATAAAYCRTCGKALCETCKRDVRGVIYCEDCLASRVSSTMPPAGPGNPAASGVVAGTPVTVVPVSGPHPAVAGVLSGFFPFGVGQVYNGQYSRGLVHMAIFIGLVWALNVARGPADTIFGFAMAAFYFYQIIDAVRSAHAIRVGLPAPDPFGFDNLFGARATVQPNRAPSAAAGAPSATAAGAVPVAGAVPPESAWPVQPEAPETRSKAPIGAIILIGLGVLFLIGNLGFMQMWWIWRGWPLILIALGVWQLSRSWDAICCGRRHGLMGPVILLTLGITFLLDSWRVVHFTRTWPLILIGIGVVLMYQRSGPADGTPLVPPTSTSTHTPSGAPQLSEGEAVQRQDER